MVQLMAFQTAAHDGGFVEFYETSDGTVLWLRKYESDSNKEAFPRVCLDTMTQSATVIWKAAPGMLTSKTFRDASAMQEWFRTRTLG